MNRIPFTIIKITLLVLILGCQTTSETAENHHVQGNLYYFEGNLTAAIDSYTKAITQAPAPKIYHNRARAYNDLKQFQKAIDDYSKAIELDPKDYNSLYFRGMILYLNFAEYKKAIDDISKAIELDGNQKKSELYAMFAGRCSIYLDLKQFQKAIDDCSIAIDLYPNQISPLQGRAMSYMSLDEYQKAIDDINKMLELDPNGEEEHNDLFGNYYILGAAYTRIGQYQKAINSLEKALKLALTQETQDSLKIEISQLKQLAK